MIVIRDAASMSSIGDPDIRTLVQQRFAEICAGEKYNYDMHGYMIVVEPGDSVQSLEQETCCPIMHNLFDADIHFGHADYCPSFEALVGHASCNEMVFIMGDSFGITIIIPKQGADPELLAMCAQYAVPAPELTEP